MKTQVLVYWKQTSPINEADEISVQDFGNAGAFDAFDLNVINLQDGAMWKSHSRDYPHDGTELNSAKDIQSIRQMIAQSKQSKCLILLPPNIGFQYDYERNFSSGRNAYMHSAPLKDFISDFSESPIGVLFDYPVSVCFGVSTTTLAGLTLTADFSFRESETFSRKVILRSQASTATVVAGSDGLALSLLQITSNAELAALIDAVYPSTKVAPFPDWLQEINFQDEEKQKEGIRSLNTEIKQLNQERTDKELILENYQQIKSILCTKDIELENEVRAIVAQIVGVPNNFVDQKEEDFRFDCDNTTFLIEVKGCLGGLKRQHVSRAYDHVQIEMDAKEECGDANDVKGVLIFASQIHTRPEERDLFPSKQLTIAERNNIAVVSTETLLRCYEALREGRLSTKKFIETLESCSGQIRVDQFGLASGNPSSRLPLE